MRSRKEPGEALLCDLHPRSGGARNVVFDQTRTDVTVLNTDGSRTETVANSAGVGASASLTDETVTITSANGLSKTTKWDLDVRLTVTAML